MGIAGLPQAADHRTIITAAGNAPSSGTITLGSIAIPKKTTWYVQQFQVNQNEAGAATVELRIRGSSEVVARMRTNAEGSFVADDNGWPVSANIGPLASADFLDIVGLTASASTISVSGGVVLIRSHDNPTSVHPAS